MTGGGLTLKRIETTYASSFENTFLCLCPALYRLYLTLLIRVKQIRFFGGSIADAFQLKRFALDHWSVRPSMASVRRATRRVALPLRHVQNT